MAEEKVREVYPSDVMKTPVHLSLGEEAIIAGVCQALSPCDQIFGTYRSHALYLAKGGNLDVFFAELYGRETGIAKGKAGSMHLSDPRNGFMIASAIVASIIPVALGGAFAAKYKGEDHIAAAFFGDGATEEGVFWETINAACLMKLPILFVCENNEWAIHAHIKNRQSYDIVEAVKPFHLNVFSESTTDAEKIFQMTRDALVAMKDTGYPSFMHLRYHRYLEHVGINEDFCFGYRCKEDYADWYERDPVKIQREKLIRLGMVETDIHTLEKEINNCIEESIGKAAAAKYADSCEVSEGVYA